MFGANVSEAELKCIYPRFMGQFINHAFMEKSVLGSPHGSPERHRDAKFWRIASDAKTFDVVGLVMTALGDS